MLDDGRQELLLAKRLGRDAGEVLLAAIGKPCEGEPAHILVPLAASHGYTLREVCALCVEFLAIIATDTEAIGCVFDYITHDCIALGVRIDSVVEAVAG